jgi:uncharacterized protein (UPF0335 family)
MDGSNIEAVTAAELRAFIERIEELRAEQADLKAQEKGVFEEMKGRGYMTRPIRTIIKDRAEAPDKRAEFEAVLEVYKAALGML